MATIAALTCRFSFIFLQYAALSCRLYRWHSLCISTD